MRTARTHEGAPMEASRPAGPVDEHTNVGDGVDRSPRDASPVRALLVMASLGAAAMHFAFAPAHLATSSVHGGFFLVVAWLQIAWAAAVAWRPSRAVYRLGVLLNVAVIGVWIASRTVGINGEAEAVGLPDAAASILEGLVVVGAFGAAERLLPRRAVRRATAGAFLGAAALAITALVSAAMVPSLSGLGASESGAAHHGGTAGAESKEAAANAAEGEDHAGHHGEATEAVEADTVEADAATAAGDHGDDGGDHKPAVAVPYDPELPIDLGGIPGVSPQQQAEAENIVSTTLLRLPRWSDTATAEAAGFRSIGDGATGVEHFINQGFMDDDVILDPDKPESLVYSTEGGGQRLVAAMFMTAVGTPLTEVPDLGGDLMQWHVHQDLCFNAAGRVAGLTNAQGGCPKGLVKPEETPMIHVWIEPHPCGPFAALEGIGAGAIEEGEERLCDSAHGG